ncbi:MAG TPA: hypothetical protein VHL80_14235 [Polyangia bacterium]|nr:hypothetical protein [Polyangia bacterium]
MSHLRSVPGKSVSIGVVLVGLLTGLAGLSRAVTAQRAPLTHLLPPENVAATTRAQLRERMSRHGNTMSTLVKAVVLIDRPTITTMAQRIADEELLARGESKGFDPWRPLLPKAFFIEQDALRMAARSLAQAAAHGESDSAVAERFAALTTTCVRCHASYLHDLPAGTADQ